MRFYDLILGILGVWRITHLLQAEDGPWDLVVQLRRALGNRRVPHLEPGDRVTHDSYGLGTVLSVEGRGDDPEAKIDFGGDYGIKHLVLRYAPIEKL